MNHSYFDKRKLFLAGLRKSLEQVDKKTSSNKGSVGERYKNFHTVLFKHDARKPLLQFQPGYSSSIYVRVIPVIPEGVFKMTHLRPGKNNVRPEAWMSRLKELKKSGKNSSGKYRTHTL